MEIDEILHLVGNLGRFQLALITLFCLMEFPNGLLIMSPYFTEENPAWKCVRNSSFCKMNGTFSVGDSGYKLRCSMPRSAWEFVKPKEFSVVTQFDIYCDKEAYLSLVQSLPFVSWAIGGIVAGWLMDKFGRRLIVLGGSAMVIILGFASAFSPNFIFYSIVRFFVGFFIPIASAHKIVLASEFVDTKHRPYFVLPIGIAFGFSACLLGLLAYFIRTWKYLLIACTAPFSLTFIFYWFVPESIRWLRLNGRIEDARSSLTRIARFNKKDVNYIDVDEIKDEPFQGLKFILDLFRPQTVAIRSLIHGYAWAVCGLVYYGVAFAAADLGGRKYRDFVLASISDLAGTFACLYILNRFGRKVPVLTSFLISGLSCIAVAIIPMRSDDGERTSLTDFRVFLGMAGKFFISISFNGVYVWSVESYPTVMRGIGMGYLQIAARVGSALAPWVAKGLKTVNEILPFALMGSSAVLCAGVLLLVPETANKPTVETRRDQAVLGNKELHVHA